MLRLGHLPVGAAANGSDAIRLADETQPDLIVMDVRLEGDMDGVQASIEITKRRPVPVVYITAYTQQFAVAPSTMVYPFLCIAKPFSRGTVEAIIESVFSLSGSGPN